MNNEKCVIELNHLFSDRKDPGNFFDGIMNAPEWVYQIFASSYKYNFLREFNQVVSWEKE